MNIIWCFLLIASILILIFKSPEIVLNCFMQSGTKTINLCIKLMAIYAVWLGILQIVQDTKLSDKISKVFEPILNFIFGKGIGQDAKNCISINLTSNMLGMGNASTPSGIDAMKFLSKGETYATTSIIMLFLLNTCNLQIIPTTIIGLRILAGSAFPSKIILPTIIVSIICISLAIFCVKIIEKFSRKKYG